MLNGKADAQVICIDPMLAKHDNVTLLTNAYVSKLGTDVSGRKVDAVHVERSGKEEIYTADVLRLVVLFLLGSCSFGRP